MHKEKVYIMFRHSLCLSVLISVFSQLFIFKIPIIFHLSSSISKEVLSVPTLYMLERRPYKTGGVAGVWVSLYQCGDPGGVSDQPCANIRAQSPSS